MSPPGPTLTFSKKSGGGEGLFRYILDIFAETQCATALGGTGDKHFTGATLTSEVAEKFVLADFFERARSKHQEHRPSWRSLVF